MTPAIFLIFASFAVFRISGILVYERGPFDLIFKFRELIGIEHDDDMLPEIIPEKFLPLLFSCTACTSVWVSLIVMLIWLYVPAIVFMLLIMPFGLSGMSVLIDSLR